MRLLEGKLSIFSFNIIKAELLKKKGSVDPDQCGCQSKLRYKLPCIHLLPEGNRPIPLSCVNKRWHLFPEDCPPQGKM
jgi:hypothetical protein